MEIKALILLGTLKQTGRSNTAVLAEFATGYLDKQGVSCEVVRLVQHNIVPGTYTDVGNPADEWPAIYNKILKADILIFATPIWWNSHSSEIQRIIERLDEVYDKIEAGEESPLAGKLGGLIVTGDRDGVEHITGNISNFLICLGVTMPPFSSLGVLYDGHAKDKKTTKAALLKHYKKEYGQDAESMAESMANLAKAMKNSE